MRTNGRQQTQIDAIRPLDQRTNTTNSKTKGRNYRSQTVNLYVDGISNTDEYGVATAMRPHTTLMHVLVHPTDQVELEEQGQLIIIMPVVAMRQRLLPSLNYLLSVYLSAMRVMSMSRSLYLSASSFS